MSPPVASLETIKIIAKALGELNEHAVFVGGATLPFYLPEVYSSQARPTEDVDIVMEVIGQRKTWINEKTLRSKAFKHDTSEGAPTCRWLYQNFKVDIMSSDISAFGFTNRWYEEGIATAIEVITKPVSVRIFSLPYFLASKIVAFQSRGNSDFIGSKDMEDIISVLEVSSHEMLEGVLSASSKDIQIYLKDELTNFLNTSDFTDAIHAAAFNRTNTNDAVAFVKNRMANISKLAL